MVWQDIVIFIGQWVFVIAFIPTIRGSINEKPPVSTSIITGLVLIVFTLTFLTLGLWLSATSSIVLAAAWLLVGWQKYQQNNKRIKGK